MSKHEYQSKDGRTIWLIDTPGFDDTFLSDVDILKEITFALSRLYEAGARMTGMIYLHRISDPRMGHSAILDLEIFKQLCGDKAMPVVRLVSTRWDSTNENVRLEREKQLKDSDKFWAGMLKAGAKVERHENTKESAVSIVENLLNDSPRIVLTIQEEIVDQQLSLADTSVGKVVAHEQQATEARYRSEIDQLRQEQQESVAARDTELSEEIAKELQRQENLRAGLQDSQESLRVGLSNMISEIQRKTADDGPSPGISRSSTSNEVVPEAVRVQIDILKQNMADLQDDFERKEKQYSEQLKQLRASSNRSPKESQGPTRHAQSGAHRPLQGGAPSSSDFARQAAVLSEKQARDRTYFNDRMAELKRTERLMKREAAERRRTEHPVASFFKWLMYS